MNGKNVNLHILMMKIALWGFLFFNTTGKKIEKSRANNFAEATDVMKKIHA